MSVLDRGEAAVQDTRLEMASTISTVRFDFHQTLLRVESTDAWIRAACDRIGRTVTDDEVGRLAARMHAVRGRPDIVEAERGKDLSPGGSSPCHHGMAARGHRRSAGECALREDVRPVVRTGTT